MSVQTNEVKETMDTPSSEGLVVHLEVSLLFHLDSTKASDVYRTVGVGYENVLVVPNVRSENLLKWKGIEATKELALSSNSKVVIIGRQGRAADYPGRRYYSICATADPAWPLRSTN